MMASKKIFIAYFLIGITTGYLSTHLIYASDDETLDSSHLTKNLYSNVTSLGGNGINQPSDISYIYSDFASLGSDGTNTADVSFIGERFNDVEGVGFDTGLNSLISICGSQTQTGSTNTFNPTTQSLADIAGTSFATATDSLHVIASNTLTIKGAHFTAGTNDLTSLAGNSTSHTGSPDFNPVTNNLAAISAQVTTLGTTALATAAALTTVDNHVTALGSTALATSAQAGNILTAVQTDIPNELTTLQTNVNNLGSFDDVSQLYTNFINLGGVDDLSQLANRLDTIDEEIAALPTAANFTPLATSAQVTTLGTTALATAAALTTVDSHVTALGSTALATSAQAGNILTAVQTDIPNELTTLQTNVNNLGSFDDVSQLYTNFINLGGIDDVSQLANRLDTINEEIAALPTVANFIPLATSAQVTTLGSTALATSAQAGNILTAVQTDIPNELTTLQTNVNNLGSFDDVSQLYTNFINLGGIDDVSQLANRLDTIDTEIAPLATSAQVTTLGTTALATAAQAGNILTAVQTDIPAQLTTLQTNIDNLGSFDDVSQLYTNFINLGGIDDVSQLANRLDTIDTNFTPLATSAQITTLGTTALAPLGTGSITDLNNAVNILSLKLNTIEQMLASLITQWGYLPVDVIADPIALVTRAMQNPALLTDIITPTIDASSYNTAINLVVTVSIPNTIDPSLQSSSTTTQAITDLASAQTTFTALATAMNAVPETPTSDYSLAQVQGALTQLAQALTILASNQLPDPID